MHYFQSKLFSYKVVLRFPYQFINNNFLVTNLFVGYNVENFDLGVSHQSFLCLFALIMRPWFCDNFLLILTSSLYGRGRNVAKVKSKLPGQMEFSWDG